MTAPVDVLAELDRRIEIGELFGQEHDLPNLPGNAALREARAAVAELMDQAETFRRIVHNAIAAGQISTKYGPHLADMEAALARCGGGK